MLFQNPKFSPIVENYGENSVEKRWITVENFSPMWKVVFPFSRLSRTIHTVFRRFSQEFHAHFGWFFLRKTG
jgi:hypothetical protein